MQPNKYYPCLRATRASLAQGYDKLYSLADDSGGAASHGIFDELTHRVAGDPAMKLKGGSREHAPWEESPI